MIVDNEGTDDDADLGGERASERLLTMIGGGIISGDLAPGEKMTEAALAKRYRVSRAPLREALVRLEERQLVERTPFSGTRVASPSLRSLQELYEIRAVLEGLAARRAATLASADQIAALRSTLATVARLAKGAGTAASSPGAPAASPFHSKIAELGGSEQLTVLLQREIWRFSSEVGRRWYRSPERIEASLFEHEQIVEAIADGDGELAEMLMRRHISAAFKGHGSPGRRG